MALTTPKFLLNYLRTGVDDQQDYETNRRTLMVNLFTLVGIIILLAMFASNAILGQWLNAAVLISMAALYLFGYLYQKRTRKQQVPIRVMLATLFMLMIYLVYYGGVGNTGPVWIFLLAPVVLYFEGLKRGIFFLAIFTIVLMVMLFAPNDMLHTATYSEAFKTRIVLSFLTVAFLSSVYEYSRQQSYEFMLEMNKKYQQLARLDPLTHLSNRRDAMDKLQYELRSVDRNNSSIALILCDIDYFKNINDEYGHETGDHVLIFLANLFNETLRKQDTVVRWGGEEFLFILPKTTAVQANVVANKIRDRVNDTKIVIDGTTIAVTLSIGISELNKQNKDINKAISNADGHLYQAKASGRNCIHPIVPASNTESLSSSNSA